MRYRSTSAMIAPTKTPSARSKSAGSAILVSEQPQVTAANYWLNNPEEVERFLQKITDRLHATEW